MNNGTLKERIRVALADVPNKKILSATRDLLDVLGYQSERTLELSGDPEKFIQQFPAPNENTSTEQTFRKHVQSIQIIFQMTNDEILSANQQTPGLESASRKEGRQKSFLFFSVELKDDNYPQGIYDEFTREIDKRIILPTVVFFRAGARLTVAVIGRRPHKRNDSYDVLESRHVVEQEYSFRESTAYRYRHLVPAITTRVYRVDEFQCQAAQLRRFAGCLACQTGRHRAQPAVLPIYVRLV